MTMIETDYLVIGAGAVSLAFVDTLLDEDPNCHITMIDMHAKPGGHWNDAYSFVALHQPSAFYGVNSMDFGADVIDDHGPNRGLYPLANGSEISAYFERLVNRRFLPSGRVRYHPLSEYLGKDENMTGTFRQVLSGKQTTVKIRRKVIDGTFYKTSVPATHTPQYEIAEGTPFAIPGELPKLWMRGNDLPGHYVIVGAGKTAMDAGVWLLEAGVDPDTITWICPRDSWMINRLYTQPGAEFFEDVVNNQIAQLKAAGAAKTGDEMFEMLGRDGYMLRIDETVKPEMFHYATISEGEIALLRQIKHVVRRGRVSAIAPGSMTFANGEESVPDDALFIDCTATAVPFTEDRVHGPQFRGDTIVLQPIHVPLVTFSSALTAFIETAFDTDEEKNTIAVPAPLTDTPNTYPLGMLINFMNRGAWSQNPKIAAWLSKARLDPTGTTVAKMMAEGDTRLSVMGGFQEAIKVGIPGLQRLAVAAREEHQER